MGCGWHQEKVNSNTKLPPTVRFGCLLDSKRFQALNVWVQIQSNFTLPFKLKWMEQEDLTSMRPQCTTIPRNLHHMALDRLHIHHMCRVMRRHRCLTAVVRHFYGCDQKLCFTPSGLQLKAMKGVLTVKVK
jgi:hypothetical protein